MISSPTRKEEGPIKDDQKENKLAYANGAADADHDNWWEGEGGDDVDGVSAAVEKGFRDYSNRTSIR